VADEADPQADHDILSGSSNDQLLAYTAVTDFMYATKAPAMTAPVQGACCKPTVTGDVCSATYACTVITKSVLPFQQKVATSSLSTLALPVGCVTTAMRQRVRRTAGSKLPSPLLLQN
jgi:hypothetical protein